MDWYKIFLMVAVFAFLLAILLGLSLVFGENYVYNFTKNETDQLIISELCYAGVDIGECKLLYGGIGTDYGEKIK